MLDTIIIDIAADREPGVAERCITAYDPVAPCYRHVINYPLVHVFLTNAVYQKFEFLSILLFVSIGFVAQVNWGCHTMPESDLQRNLHNIIKPVKMVRFTRWREQHVTHIIC